MSKLKGKGLKKNEGRGKKEKEKSVKGRKLGRTVDTNTYNQNANKYTSSIY